MRIRTGSQRDPCLAAGAEPPRKNLEFFLKFLPWDLSQAVSTVSRRRKPYCSKLLTNENKRSRMCTCAERAMVKIAAIISEFGDGLDRREVGGAVHGDFNPTASADSGCSARSTLS